ncbi:MAG TPA: GNAT family N-acetyltransferase [Prosthecobacter sp.]|nr:GNAT family N-acetyltransferase [Prosthecobacter sp.]
MKVLQTMHCILEPLCERHASEMYPLLCDPRLYEFLSLPPPVSLETLAERYRRLETRTSADGKEQWLNWIIRLRNGGVCVGFVQATLYSMHQGDVGFVLGADHWGRGLAGAAVGAILELLFAQHGVKSLFATVDRQNWRSIALLTRLGFRQVKQSLYPHGKVAPSDDVFQIDAAVANT